MNGTWKDIDKLEKDLSEAADNLRANSKLTSNDYFRRRFAAGMRHFLETYRQRVDYWMWFDNSGLEPVLFDEGKNS